MPPSPRRSLGIEGVRVGHWTADPATTGCTVLLVEQGAVAGVDVRGGAPASRETDLLRPENLVQQIHAVVLSGGSAFGLDASSGVMRFLEERERGFPTRAGVVPIVVAASLYDLGFGGSPTGSEAVRPGAAQGYAAAQAAGSGFEVGSVGAGAGATVGKLLGSEHAMRGGIGAAVLTLADGTRVAALVAVNAVGDVVDSSTGEVVAGMQRDGVLLDARRDLGDGAVPPRENTTIGVVVTDAVLDQAQATKVAQMAHDGMARAIYPSHTPGDGDTLFVVATGSSAVEADVLRIGARAADAVQQAILDAVRSARPGFGVPTATELSDRSASRPPAEGAEPR